MFSKLTATFVATLVSLAIGFLICWGYVALTTAYPEYALATDTAFLFIGILLYMAGLLLVYLNRGYSVPTIISALLLLVVVFFRFLGYI